MEITKQNGQNLGGRVLKDGSTTFEWLVRNRYFPLRKGNWRPQTAKEKMAQIEFGLIDKFGDQPLDSFDKFMLQTHLNGDRLPKGAPAVRQDSGEPHQSPSSRWLGERTAAMEAGVQKSFVQEGFTGCLHLPERGWRLFGYRQLSVPGSETSGGRAWYPQTELPDPAPDDGHPGAEYGIGEGHPSAPAAFETGHHGSYAGAAGERAGDGRIGLSNVDERRGRKNVF
jgi:hypothetical protein